MNRNLIQSIASTVDALRRCQQKPDEFKEAIQMHLDHIKQYEAALPSGSGIDQGTKIDLDASHRNRIVLHADFHHMNDSGFYDGWTSHRIVVTPDLAFGFNVSVGGRNRNDIKEYLYDVYGYALNEPYNHKHAETVNK